MYTRFDGLPMQPVAPPSPDYVPGPEHPPSPIEIPYVPEPEYPEYLVPSEDEAPMEDQPLTADASPVALSPGYVPDSDPEEDPEEDSEEEHLITLLTEGYGGYGDTEDSRLMELCTLHLDHSDRFPFARHVSRMTFPRLFSASVVEKLVLLTPDSPVLMIGDEFSAGAARTAKGLL
ncbi:hypothetical protein Tco_0588166 [Tanacetum coccineum]